MEKGFFNNANPQRERRDNDLAPILDEEEERESEEEDLPSLASASSSRLILRSWFSTSASPHPSPFTLHLRQLPNSRTLPSLPPSLLSFPHPPPLHAPPHVSSVTRTPSPFVLNVRRPDLTSEFPLAGGLTCPPTTLPSPRRPPLEREIRPL